MSTDNALVLSGNNTLSNYGQRADVNELVSRLMMLHPQAQEVGERGMMIVAQTAVLLGANPLPGANELHVWKDKDGKTCFQLGINYLRRKGQEWGGVLFSIRPREMKANERQEYGIPNGNTAAICFGVRADDMVSWHGRGFSANQIFDMCGRVGIGMVGQNEYAKKGRPQIWTAFLRAERDMMRQLFPTQMKQIDNTIPDEPVTDDWQPSGEIIDYPGDENTNHFSGQTIDQINDDLFGSAPVNRQPAPPPAIRPVPAGLNQETEEVLTPVTIDPVKWEQFRGKVANNPRNTVGSVASAVTGTGAYRSDAHALNAAKLISADLEKSLQLSKEDALRLFDQLIERKQVDQAPLFADEHDKATGYAE